MNSRLNNQQTENQQEQQIFSSSAAATTASTTSNTATRKEEQFRQVFFDSSNKRSNASSASSSSSTSPSSSSTSTSTASSSSRGISSSASQHDIQSNKRARIEVLEAQQDESIAVSSQILTPTPISPKNTVSSNPQITADALLNIAKQQQSQQQLDGKKWDHHPNVSNIKRYRSRSLPNVLYSALRRRNHHHHHHHQHMNTLSENVINAVPSMAINFPHHHSFLPPPPSSNKSSPPPLPPVSLQSLREIDLHEILKNPQLRHDILFDPQLQFRPNLDGERGRKKKMAVDKYWDDLQHELELYIVSKEFNEKNSRLPPLFQTLKEILISLLPTKDVDQVNETMDTELLIQQLKNYSFDFVSLAQWLSQIFKSHCAPMRDSWVDEMTSKCVTLKQENSISSLVDGLRMIFSILEAMKLDVANHQIRILRPVLVETLVDFERNYFTQMVSRCKMNLQDSINWFVTNYKNCESEAPIKLKELSTLSILKLLSCRHMVTSFPTSLSFDHARLVLLRADIRQLVCLQLCVLLYKQMLYQYSTKQHYKVQPVKPESVNRLKREILAIVTDDNGNIKWTRNVGSIALQLSKLCITAAEEDVASANLLKTPPESMVQFAFNWLIKQTQPSSQVYGLMEEKIFKQLMEFVNNVKDDEMVKEEIVSSTMSPSSSSSSINLSSTSNVSLSSKSSLNSEDSNDENHELNQLGSRVAKLCNFHWSVFGNIYTDAISKL